jgi:hypothetical protein
MSPVSYTYTAPSEPAMGGSVTLESRSRRGVAKPAYVSFTVKEVQAYEGDIAFSGNIESPGSSTVTWSGTMHVKVNQDSLTMGGALYSLDASSTATFDSWKSEDAIEVCTFTGPLTVSGPSAIFGTFAVSFTDPKVYGFMITATGMATATCVNDDGDTRELTAPLIGYARTEQMVGDGGLQPITDPLRLEGSSHFEQAGLMTNETSWSFDAIVD